MRFYNVARRHRRHKERFTEQAIDMHSRRLRNSLNASGEVDLVQTVRAAGYALGDP